MEALINLENISVAPITEEIMELNAYTSEYGLTLSYEDARALSETRVTALQENERIELGNGAVGDIIRKFCTSRYLTEENYPYVITEITNIFYYIKTETDDMISDRELIDELFNRFELWCLGDIDTLLSREAEKIIRKVNSGENYEEWYADRDELEGDAAMREAPGSVSEDAYGRDFFSADGASASDGLYVPDEGEKEMLYEYEDWKEGLEDFTEDNPGGRH